MPIHDWTRVDAGTFHFFHMRWIASICDVLNEGMLPRNYYAMGEQRALGDEPDVLTLHAAPFGDAGEEADGYSRRRRGTRILDDSKQNSVVVRHVSGDRVVAMIEVVSWGNKATRLALEQFVRKVGRFLDQGIHLLIIDIQPPGGCDPQGIHGAIWDYVAGKTYSAPIDKPLTIAAYESDVVFRAYVEPVAVGDPLPEMPLFLRPGHHVQVPLETTYETTWRVFPQRWKDVIAPRR